MKFATIKSALLSFLKIKKSGKKVPTFGPKARFIYFPALPKELRIMIWTFAVPPPYILEQPCLISRTRRIQPPFAFSKANKNLHAFLHACRESREEFLHQNGVAKSHPTFQFITGASSNDPPMIFVGKGFKTWFSFEQDALWVISTDRFVKCKMSKLLYLNTEKANNHFSL